MTRWHVIVQGPAVRHLKANATPRATRIWGRARDASHDGAARPSDRARFWEGAGSGYF
jgi:hypothetical protein